MNKPKVIYQNELVDYLMKHGMNSRKFISKQLNPIVKPTEYMTTEEREIFRSYIITSLIPRVKDILSAIEQYALSLR